MRLTYYVSALRGYVMDSVKTIAEFLAFLGAALFFAFKLFTGFFIFNLSVALKCERKTNVTTGTDGLVITASLKKGDMSVLVRHDIRAKVSYETEARVIPFAGFFRASYHSDTSDGFERKVAVMDTISRSSPFLNLVPGEEASFSCVTEIPSTATVRVDLVVLGKRAFVGVGVGQWRSTAVILPGQSANQSLNPDAKGAG